MRVRVRVRVCLRDCARVLTLPLQWGYACACAFVCVQWKNDSVRQSK